MNTPSLYSDNQRLLFFEKAHINKEIKTLLIPWFSFRLYIYFKPNSNKYGDARNGRHFYGNEHRCTYNQCLYNRVADIKLDKKIGYTGLIQLVEKGSFKGTYLSAKIYTESIPGSNTYDILLREYSKGKVVKTTLNEPDFLTHDKMIIRTVDETGNVATEETRDSVHTLYYAVEKGRLQISEAPVRLYNTEE